MDDRSNSAAGAPEEFAAHAQALRALARALLGRSAEAEDLVQDTWLAWLRSPPREGTSARSWLVRVLTNRAVSLRRGHARREAREREVARPELVQQELQLERDEALRRVVAAVLALEPASKEVVWRRYFEGQSVERIAADLRLSRRVVYERLEKAHSALRRSLERDFGDERRALSGLALLAGTRGETALVAGGALASPVVWLAAAALLIGAVAWFASRPAPVSPALARADDARGGARPQAVDDVGALDAAPEPDSAERNEIESSDEVVETPPRWAPPGFEYELDVQLLDEFGLPVAAANVLAAPAGRTLNFVGATDRDGRVRIGFRAFTPRVELDLAKEARGVRERVSIGQGRSTLELRTQALGRLSHRDDGTLHGAFFGRGRGAVDGSFRIQRGGLESVVAAWRDALELTHFVQPWLIEESEPQPPQLAELDLPRPVWLEAFRGAGLRLPGSALVRGQVSDASGAQLTSVLAHARHESDSLWRSFTVDELGAFSARELQSGRWELHVCASGLGEAREEFTLESGAERRCELRLDPGRVFRARLIDVDGAPCSGWRVELCTLDSATLAVDSATTDGDGRVCIANAPSGPLQVRARPAQSAQRPSVVLAQDADASGAEQLLRLPFAADGALAELELELSPSELRGPPDYAVRVRRVGGRELAPLVSPASETAFSDGSPASRGLLGAIDELLPGSYEIEVQASARGVVTLPPLELVAGVEHQLLRSVAFETPARLRVEARPTRSGGARAVRLRKRDAQFELVSAPFDVSHEIELTLEPGDYELVTASTLVRWADLEVGAGETWVVRADGRVEQLSPAR